MKFDKLTESYLRLFSEADFNRDRQLEKPQNYMFILKSKGFKQVSGLSGQSGHKNTFKRGNDTVTVDKDLAGDTFTVTVNGVVWKGTLDRLQQEISDEDDEQTQDPMAIKNKLKDVNNQTRSGGAYTTKHGDTTYRTDKSGYATWDEEV